MGVSDSQAGAMLPSALLAQASLMGHGLDDLLGPVVIIDANLQIVMATPAAEDITGEPLHFGASIVKVLCGQSEHRPIAEALAQGNPVTGAVMRMTGNGSLRSVEVKASPILREGKRLGWVLRLSADDLTEDEAEATLFHGMWTRDPSLRRIFHIIERAAKRDVSVLVRGPSGAGKELVAQAIHALSPRRDKPFRAINCAALPPNLLESELFGHVKGSFTGAVKDSPGIFRAAAGGTLFLDEVAEMPLELQAKLLRVLETHTVIPVGDTQPVAVDVRIVAATHQSLRDAVEKGRFRADLMYRLRVVPIFLPALAERAGDVRLLVEKFIDELNREGGRKVARVSPGAMAAMERYAWPGNIRELRNALQYAYVIGEGETLVEADLPPEVLGEQADEPVRANAPVIAASKSEQERISIALERAGGSKDRAARMLGMSRVTLWRRLKALGLESDKPERAGSDGEG